MTAVTLSQAGASSTDVLQWNAIDWHSVSRNVKRLQVRIAKAMKEGRTGKAKALQYLLTKSFQAKLLAVKRVTGNRGARTAGIDKITWQTAKDKMAAVATLRRRGYRAKPLRRIYIPKRNGKRRPLGIPTMKDRAMQALHLLALEPISETLADGHSYGFRPKRAAADAIEHCFTALAPWYRAQWILEGDIKACFDQISHQWLRDNIPMDEQVLGQWLKSGYVEENAFHSTRDGTPQGGIISPTLANMTLDGLNDAIKCVVKSTDKVNFVRYADDFIVTGASKDVLENKVKPAIEAFLRERGLILSEDKTAITHINDGFDFLGFNVRKYGGKLLIKPAKASVSDFLEKVRTVIGYHKASTAGDLIAQLNPIIRGWCNYFRHVVASETFSKLGCAIYQMLRRWIKRRHPNKGSHFWRMKYFRTVGNARWVFTGTRENQLGEPGAIDLFGPGSIKIVRHTKIRSIANPYDPEFKDYFIKRIMRYKRNRQLISTNVSYRYLAKG